LPTQTVDRWFPTDNDPITDADAHRACDSWMNKVLRAAAWTDESHEVLARERAQLVGCAEEHGHSWVATPCGKVQADLENWLQRLVSVSAPPLAKALTDSRPNFCDFARVRRERVAGARHWGDTSLGSLVAHDTEGLVAAFVMGGLLLLCGGASALLLTVVCVPSHIEHDYDSGRGRGRFR